MNKKEYGQFYTTNFNYILTDINCDDFKNKKIIEPFVGGADLIKWLKNKNIPIYNIEIYDIEPNKNINNIFPNLDLKKIQRDTLLNPPNYNNSYVITNPPYLAKNKSNGKNKEIFNKYKNISDLFRIHIQQIIEKNCLGGIEIIPLNFFSSIKKQDIKIRDNFLQKYKIIKLNIFEEKVFNDTSCTICSFKFLKSNNNLNEQNISITFFPSKKNQINNINKKNQWLFGGEIYNKNKKYNFKVNRLTEKNKNLILKKGYIITNIKLIGLDSGSLNNKIRLEYNEKHFYGKQTDRVFATIIIKSLNDNNDIIENIENQKKIINIFNKYLNEMREKYNSLFLTNYRESKNENGRKRISFKLSYKLINDILEKL